MFMNEFIVKGGVALDHIILRGVSEGVFDLPIYIHEGGTILETPLKIMRSRTSTPLTITSMLKHII